MNSPKYTLIYQIKSGCSSTCNVCHKKIHKGRKRVMVDPSTTISYSKINCADLCSLLCAELHIVKTYE